MWSGLTACSAVKEQSCAQEFSILTTSSSVTAANARRTPTYHAAARPTACACTATDDVPIVLSPSGGLSHACTLRRSRPGSRACLDGLRSEYLAERGNSIRRAEHGNQGH